MNDGYIEPISFIVPRRAEVFQGDIYPPVTGTKPAMSSAEWFAGKDALPPKIDLESVYAGEEPAEVPSTYKPTPQPAPAANIPSPTKKEPEPVKSAPQPSPAVRDSPPSMKEQTSSISNLTSKFVDNDESESEDEDSSSFEEIPKPVDRSEKQPQITPKPEDHSERVAMTKGLGGASDPVSSHPPAPKAESQTSKVKYLKITLIPLSLILHSLSNSIKPFLLPAAPPPSIFHLRLPWDPSLYRATYKRSSLFYSNKI